MEYLLYFGLITLVVALLFHLSARRGEVSSSTMVRHYSYARKQFIMTRAENDFYKTLQEAIGTSYMIYPQAHLDLFLDHKIKGQSWRGALSAIQRKSVDFLICSREYYNPLVAIELDDSSHRQDDRVERDNRVDAICSDANMPLVRVKWQRAYDSNELLSLLAPYLH